MVLAYALPHSQCIGGSCRDIRGAALIDNAVFYRLGKHKEVMSTHAWLPMPRRKIHDSRGGSRQSCRHRENQR